MTMTPYGQIIGTSGPGYGQTIVNVVGELDTEVGSGGVEGDAATIQLRDTQSIVYATDYGLLEANTGAQNATALTAALTACVSYGVLELPAGWEGALTTLTISVEGLVINGNGCKFTKTANTDSKMFIITADRVTIDRIRIDGNIANQSVLSNNNDTIHWTGVDYITIKNCYIVNSSASGITGGSAGHCQILNNEVINSRDNGILLGGLGADYNLIQGNHVDGTTLQNCIFITASPGSTETTDYIYYNKILGNTCKDTGDAAIESGIRAVGSIVQGNQCIAGGILIRDNLYPNVDSNFIDATGAPTGSDCIVAVTHHSGVGLVPTAWGSIQNNICVGALGNGITVNNGDGWLVQNNVIKYPAAYGIYSAGDQTIIRNNYVVNSAGLTSGIALAQDDTSQAALSDVLVEHNYVTGFGNGITCIDRAASRIVIRFNHITGISGNAVHLGSTTVASNDCWLYGNDTSLGLVYTNRDVFITAPDVYVAYTDPGNFWKLTDGTNSRYLTLNGDNLEFINAGNTDTLFRSRNDGRFEVQGRLEGYQGANVTAATNITLGRGNYFVITGATQIDHIDASDWTAGSIVTLQFASNPIVRHGIATSGAFYIISLAGAANFASSASDILMLLFDGTGWREVSRSVI